MKKNLLLKVIFEDQYLIAFDKPCGLVTDKSESQKEPQNTLEGLLEEIILRATPLSHRRAGRSGGVEKLVLSSSRPSASNDISSIPERSGIVHRLDKETSGVLLVAKTLDVQLALQKQFQERKVEKTYLALVFGSTPADDFEVDAPISRNPRNKTKFGVSEDGKKAVTKFKKIKEVRVGDKLCTLVEAAPITGRTHQIRVHLASVGCPVVGDILYAGKIAYELGNKHFGRLMLHAHKISFTHPISGKHMTIESPLPREFKSLF